MDCIKLQGCPFYNDKMPMDRGVGAIYKKKYCKGNQLQCARYMVMSAFGSAYVSPSLYPNMVDVARKIISEANNVG